MKSDILELGCSVSDLESQYAAILQRPIADRKVDNDIVGEARSETRIGGGIRIDGEGTGRTCAWSVAEAELSQRSHWRSIYGRFQS